MEFALILPVFMLVLGGVLQYGVILWGQNTLTQVVRDTARWAATQGSCSDNAAVVETANQVAARSSLVGYSAWTSDDVGVDWSASSSWVGNGYGKFCPPSDNQGVAWVCVTVDHTVPIFFPLVPGDGHLRSSARFRVEPVANATNAPGTIVDGTGCPSNAADDSGSTTTRPPSTTFVTLTDTATVFTTSSTATTSTSTSIRLTTSTTRTTSVTTTGTTSVTTSTTRTTSVTTTGTTSTSTSISISLTTVVTTSTATSYTTTRTVTTTRTCFLFC